MSSSNTRILAALDVAEKSVAEADIAVRAFDQARHVANREAVKIRVFHDADLRVQCGEGIRRDFGPRGEMAVSSVDLPALG